VLLFLPSSSDVISQKEIPRDLYGSKEFSVLELEAQLTL
jgi:hypothetical protein